MHLRPIGPVGLALVLALLGACQAPVPVQGSASPTLVASAPRAIGKATPRAKIQAQDHSLKLQISFPAGSQGFRTRAIDCGQGASARVSITGPGLSVPIYADDSDGQHRLQTAGCSLTASFANVPYGLRLISVELLDGSGSVIPGASLAGVLKVAAGSQELQLSYRQLPVAGVVSALIAAGPAQEFFAQSLDLSALQTRVDGLTGRSGDFPDESYTTHPELINASLLATDLYEGHPGAAAKYRQAAGSLNVNVTGLLGDDKLLLSVADPLSQAAEFGSAGGSLPDVLPGTGWPLTATLTSDADIDYSLVLNRPTADIVAGQSSALTITATPAAPTLDALPVSEIGTGQPLVLSGSQFHPDAGVTSVSIGGQPAEILSIRPHRIVVTVPNVAGNDREVRVQVGDQVVSSQIDVRQIYYVNAAQADDSGDGGTWATAKAGLQAALALAGDGDEIRIAEGSYTPGSAREDSFVIPAGVSVYGGFDASDPVDDPGRRDVSADETVLSGEIGQSDDRSDNSYHVVTGSEGVSLDGLTLARGYANGDDSQGSGGGMLNSGISLSLNNLIFRENFARTGGGVYSQNCTLTGSKLSFSDNTSGVGNGMANTNGTYTLEDIDFEQTGTPTVTPSFAAGIYGNRATMSITRARFIGLKSTLYGAAIYQTRGDITLRDVVFQNNYSGSRGGAIYQSQSNLTISNTIFTGNQAGARGAGLYHSSTGSVKMANVTFSDNFGGGALVKGSSTLEMANVLFWHSSLYDTGLMTETVIDADGNELDQQGNVIAADTVDPFYDSSEPAGPDGEWFYQEEGLRLYEQSLLISKGVDQVTGLTIPSIDPHGIPRPLGDGVEPGAYEGAFSRP